MHRTYSTFVHMYMHSTLYTYTNTSLNDEIDVDDHELFFLKVPALCGDDVACKLEVISQGQCLEYDYYENGFAIGWSPSNVRFDTPTTYFPTQFIYLRI